MTLASHEPSRLGQNVPWPQLLVRELWASLAISVIWLAVLFDALFGPSIVTSSGGSTSTVPSAIVVAFFAFLATWVVARYGLRQRER